jgi:NAD(P)H-dependent FMN reductase
MQITIISASTRAGSESRNVSDLIEATLENKNTEASVIDLYELSLPIFDATGEGDWTERVAEVRQLLDQSDGFVFVSPEWDGMMSAGLHNLFHYLDHELADKPVYLVGVSAGRGGRYPLLQMRQMGYKNRHFVIIPESIFFDQVTDNLVDGNLKNEHIEKRLNYGLNTLIEYAKALTNVRKSGVIDYEQFGNGW